MERYSYKVHYVNHAPEKDRHSLGGSTYVYPRCGEFRLSAFGADSNRWTTITSLVTCGRCKRLLELEKIENEIPKTPYPGALKIHYRSHSIGGGLKSYAICGLYVVPQRLTIDRSEVTCTHCYRILKQSDPEGLNQGQQGTVPIQVQDPFPEPAEPGEAFEDPCQEPIHFIFPVNEPNSPMKYKFGCSLNSSFMMGCKVTRNVAEVTCKYCRKTLTAINEVDEKIKDLEALLYAAKENCLSYVAISQENLRFLLGNAKKYIEANKKVS